jgi:hypothetical protein
MKANATKTHQIKSDRATKRYGQLMIIEEFINERTAYCFRETASSRWLGPNSIVRPLIAFHVTGNTGSPGLSSARS